MRDVDAAERHRQPAGPHHRPEQRAPAREPGTDRGDQRARHLRDPGSQQHTTPQAGQQSLDSPAHREADEGSTERGPGDGGHAMTVSRLRFVTPGLSTTAGRHPAARPPTEPSATGMRPTRTVSPPAAAGPSRTPRANHGASPLRVPAGR